MNVNNHSGIKYHGSMGGYNNLLFYFLSLISKKFKLILPLMESVIDKKCKCIETNIPQKIINDLPLKIGVSFQKWAISTHSLGIGLVKRNP